jgi:hypothetical protein
MALSGEQSQSHAAGRIADDAAHEIFVMSRKRAGKPVERHSGFLAFVAAMR